MSQLLDYFTDRTESIIALLTDMVNHESFSHAKAHIDQLAQFVAGICREYGAESVEIMPQSEVGDFVLAKWNADAPGKPIMFMGHLDTVWDIGTLADRPVTIDDDGEILYGPGTVDMKAGLAIGLSAIHGLVERGEMPERPVWFFFNSDEEIGSKVSTPVIRDLAQHAGLVIVLEPSAPDGSLKTMRKGIATYRVSVIGKASHAGNAPEEGVNAIIEIAQHALALHQLNDLRNGTSVSVTKIDGGTAGNVIPASASIYVDTRFLTEIAMHKIKDAIDNLHPLIPGAQVTAELLHSRPPMERNATMQATITQCKQIGAAYGVTVRETSVGGGSDGNITAAMGIPTLDGIGAEGDGLHALHEQVRIRSLPRRAALCAGIIKDWQMS